MKYSNIFTLIVLLAAVCYLVLILEKYMRKFVTINEEYLELEKVKFQFNLQMLQQEAIVVPQSESPNTRNPIGFHTNKE